jgi:hypothetical protein
MLTLLTAATLSVGGLKADTIADFSSRAGFSGNDALDWGQSGTCQPSVAAPVNATSTGGVNVTASPATGSSFAITQQMTATGGGGCPSFDGWRGNFAAGDNLLWTDGGATGPIKLTFNQAISGVGFQIESAVSGDFTAEIAAFDSSNNLLGTFSESGTSAFTADNSAIFLGLQDQTGMNVSSVVISLTAATSGNVSNFAINQLSLDTVASAPEPSSLAITLGLVVGLVALAYRRKKRLQLSE